MKRQATLRISQDDFVLVAKQCDSDPNTICSFGSMKSIFSQIPSDQQPEWVMDILDSDPPNLNVSKRLKRELYTHFHAFTLMHIL